MEIFQYIKKIQDIGIFQDMEIILDMELILDMEIIPDMEVKHHTLYCTTIVRRKYIYCQVYNLYDYVLY